MKVNKVLATVGSNATLSATITTTSGGKIGSGQAEFYVDGELVDTVGLSLGVASYKYAIASDAENIIHNVSVVYLGTKDYENSTGSNILGVQTISNVTVVNHTATINEQANIKAKVMSGGKNIASGNVDIYIDNTKVATAKISKGTVNTNITIPTTFDKGSHTLSIVYAGNDTVASAIGDAVIVLNPMNPVFHYNQTVVGIGQNASLVLAIDNGLTGNELFTANDGNVSIKLNNQVLTDSSGKVIYGTMKNGTLTIKFTAPAQLEGNQNLTFIYTGNSKFANGTQTYENGLKIGKKDINITVNKISTVRYKDNVTITGKITDMNGKGLYNINAIISINGKQSKAKTDTTGAFTLTTTANVLGTNNVTVSYAGNTNYKTNSTKTTFKVNKQNIIVTVNSIKTVRYKDNVTITGKVSDINGKGLYNINALIYINGKLSKAKTNVDGVFTLTTTANVLGTNNVTVSYPGNSNYNSNSTKTTFKVNKQNIIVTVNSIKTVRYKDDVTITGKITDKNGKALYNINALIYINGKLFKAKTDTTGAFTLTTTANTIGTNNVTVSYPGNSNYNSNSTKTTFKVNKQNIIITANSIKTVKYKGNVTITGKITDKNGKALYNINAIISINGKQFKAKTDTTGAFTLTTTATTIGTNNVTISYAGNTNYNSYETTTTFKVTS